MQAAYADDAVVDAVTREMVARGETVFQIHRLAESERDHVRALLEFFDPPPRAVVLDLGCGVGGVASLMQEMRRDLGFVLLNQSAAQLALCPAQFIKILGSFEAIPPLDCVEPDAAMMQYALGHGDVVPTMDEAARVLPVGGVFFLYDLTSLDGGRELEEVLAYKAWSPAEIEDAAARAGFRLDRFAVPERVFVEHFFDKMSPALFARIFADVEPMLFRFAKR